MKLRLLTAMAVTASLFSTQAQNGTTSATSDKPLIPVVKLSDNVQVKFGGFVRAEYYMDTRETVGAVDDLFSFFPESSKINSGDGKDQNALFRQNFSTQATRFNALFTAPDVCKAKTSAFFEYDFTGGAATQTSTGATNAVGLRLRHAWMKLSWNKLDLLIGKTWNPLAEVAFPSVVGLNTGIPFRPFGRGDQIRATLKVTSNLSILAAAVFQSEHKTYVYNDATGAGVSNTNDIRANLLPDMHLQLLYTGKTLQAGLMSEFKRVKPATQTTGTAGGTFNANETVSSFSLGGFADYKQQLLNLKGSVIYAQNLSELFQQGGYAVASYNALTGARTYTPSNSLSVWANATYGKTIVAGLFGGYQKNLGFSDNLLAAATFLGRWQNIDHIYRIAPSLSYITGRWKFQGEVEYNVAAYGTIDYADKGKVKNASEISGIRGTLATTFSF